MRDRTASLLGLLQLADGLFPSGGFAHSFGLETYVQDGIVRDAAGLADLIAAQLGASAGPGDAVAVACAGRAAMAHDVATCLDLDARLDAMKIVPEFRAASVQMGRQTARVGRVVAPHPLVHEIAGAVDAATTPGHHAMVFGAVAGRLGVEAEAASAAYLWSTAALLVNAALRLLPLGQVQGQAILAGVRPLIVRLAARAAASAADDMWSFAPGLELAGLRHARLESRLFRS